MARQGGRAAQVGRLNMSRPPYWAAQQRVGQVPLSARDTLVVSLVMRAGAWYVRLRVHRRVPSGAGVRTVGGNRGLVLPVGVAAAVADLLQQAVGQVPRTWWQERR